MNFGRSLHKGDAKKLRVLQHKLGKGQYFKDLPDMQFFTIGASKEVYQKMGNSHSVSTRTGKDAIFTLRAKVKRCSPPTEALA